MQIFISKFCKSIQTIVWTVFLSKYNITRLFLINFSQMNEKLQFVKTNLKKLSLGEKTH